MEKFIEDARNKIKIVPFPKSDGKVKTYFLSWCCDEGFSKPEETFRATSVESVVNYMHANLSKYVRKLNTIDLGKYLNYNECAKVGTYYDKAKSPFILALTPSELYSVIRASYVDGDSSFEMGIHEIKEEDIIHLSN
jgi:hypothetical protein